MSAKNVSDSYEVGYGRPPRSTQFQKGISGNPKGRPKKVRDFDHELLRESRTPITLNENGSRRRISKHEAAIKQLINKAISGNIPAPRTYLDRYQMAFERVALLEAAQARGRARPITELTEEELEERINDLEKKIEKAKEHASNVNRYFCGRSQRRQRIGIRRAGQFNFAGVRLGSDI